MVPLVRIYYFAEVEGDECFPGGSMKTSHRMTIRFLKAYELSGKSRLIVSTLAIITLILAASLSTSAQNITASVRGAVTDTQGAAITGANVTITNVDTADSRSQKSDKEGYNFPSLPIGRYSLTVAMEGFKTFEVKDVVLHVNDSLTFDAVLSVGTRSETIEVAASATQVELNNADLSGTIAGKQITELPLNGRSFAQLLTLVPGVAQDNGFQYNQKGLNGAADLSISGGASNANTFLVDGANNVDVGSGRTLLVYPSIDSIEEFKVERNSYGAQYGGNSGGQVTLITKSGTNQWHGSAYYFGRNDVLDANNTNLKANSPGAPTPKLRRNDFGYTIGGPVWKDKAFFFWSQEWNRQITGRVNSGHVPTPLDLTGDFSDQANDSSFTQPGVTVGCLPAAGLSDPAGGVGGAFTASPNNSAATGAGFIDVIPTSRMSPAGVGVLSTYLAPTLPQGAPGYGCGTNFSKSFNQANNFREESIRGDVNLTKSMKLMLRYLQDNNTFGPPATGSSGWGADSGTSLLGETWAQPSRIAVARLSKTIGTTAVNDFQFSFSDNRININPTNQAAATALSSLFPQFMPAANKGFTPENGPATWINAGSVPTVWNFGPWSNAENLYTFQDDFSKVIGRHTLKLGALYSRNQKNQDLFDTENGALNGVVGYGGCKGHGPLDPEPAFCQGLTANQTGYGLSDLYLSGMAFGWGEQGNFFSNLGRWQNLEWYVQDDIRISSRLTLNLGMRYSYFPNPYAANDKYTVFNQAAYDPNLGNATCNGLYYSPGLLTNPCPPGTGGLPGPNRALRNNFNRGFAPRVGFAWDPTGSAKWSIRAGFGQYYNRDDISLTDGLGGANPPFVGNFRSVNGNGRFLDNTNPLPACNDIAADCFGVGLGNASVGTETVARQPYTLQYNFTVQHELWRDTRLEVGYVGSRTSNAQSKYDANAILPSDRLAFAQSNGSLTSLKPYSPISTGNIAVFGYHGKAQYDSLQTAFDTRFRRSVRMSAVYTFSRTTSDVALRSNNGNGNLILDPFNLSAMSGYATIHRPHIFAANVIYDTPEMRDWNRVARTALANWEAGTIVNVSSGTPYTAVINSFTAAGSGVNDLSGIGLGNGAYRPNIVPGQPCRNSSFAQFQWVNPNRYTLNGLNLGSIGNEPVNSCLGPGVARVDLSLSRNVHLTERVNMQLRIDAFNLFNHPQFNNPNNGNTNGYVNIGFNAVNTPGTPAFADATGTPTTTLANAVSVIDSKPNAVVGQVTSDNQRDRQLQYSIRFTF
jgi:Carboxypeptidase regulatory-like domain/TonB-dependent Receptor Plug Domain